MNTKALLVLLVSLFTLGSFSQDKVFVFNDIQCRNKYQKWERFKKIGERAVLFSPETIELTIDAFYNLSIKKTTQLPNNGMVYLCKDENQQDVTVTLIGEERMFVYVRNKRFLINFKQANRTPIVATALVNTRN